MSEDKKIEYIQEDGGDSFGQKYKKIKKELIRVKKERREYLDGWQRALAEAQNLVKQKELEAQEFRKYASSEIVLKILPFLDNLGLIIQSSPENIKDGIWFKGIENTRRHLEDALRGEGLLEIKAEVGGEFDPSLHDAILGVEADEKSGTIAEVIQKGYMLNGKVIRPARVKVAK